MRTKNKYLKIILALFTALTMLFGFTLSTFAENDTAVTTTVQTGWNTNESETFYINQTGQRVTDWQWIDNARYYFNADGIMQVGWVNPGGVWYYLNSAGQMQTGWQKVDNQWYYLNASGAMLTGWQLINNSWYYMNSDGIMLTGWQKIGGKWYYLRDSGAMATGWQYVDNQWYYLDSNGAMLTGWQLINGKWYLLSSSGAMLTGWQKVGGNWYYMNSSGAMLTGWQYINNQWYYLNSSGAMLTGWQQIGGQWYYMNGSGAMVNGQQKLGYKTYIFAQSGRLLAEAYRQYSDKTCTVNVYRIWYANAWCYCAHVQLSDYARFGSTSANGYYNNGTETTWHAGNRIKPILCVNGDFAYQKAEPHAAVRKGVVEAKGDKKVYACEAYNSKTGILFNAYEGYCYPGTNTKCSSYTYNQAVQEGLITDTFIFGTASLNNGTIKGTNGGSQRPRTLIGTNGQAGDLWLIATAGDYSDGVSTGLTSYEGVALLKELGCTFGGHLDGGGSSAMYFRGEMLVANEGWEGRSVADFAFVK